ncbi:General secretion pathway protein K [Pseudohaliea rubra DSM 19751]|uniref:Type II secretion system protein K n=1 Tax=Pseudohaliea rubra DSM 19751 TaxID=1265313 RepID=A0A095VV74_9GAMM|nr:General secretion pathway protein K [Pseudohaliea rubra DSM 19751]
MVALLVFALAAVLLVALQREFSLFYRRAGNQLLAEQSWAYLRGAEALAALALARDYELDQQREAPRDDLSELWAQESAPYALDEGGWLMGDLQDLQGRFNLNLLAARGETAGAGGLPSWTPAQAFFIRLLVSFEDLAVDQTTAIAVTEAIGDWLDADQMPRANGAEDDSYLVRTPAYRAANRPMVSVSELRAVAGVTAALYARLEPLVTVWPEAPGGLNIHTMPPALLRAVNRDGSLEPLPEADVEALLEQRRSTGFADKRAFLQDPVFGGATLERVGTLLGESSNWFLLAARVEIADREQRLYSVLHREARAVRSVMRASGSL